MNGRRPDHPHLKLIKGNPGKRPIKKPGLVAASGMPSAPPELCPDSLAEWNRLASGDFAKRIITSADRAVFAMYCTSYGNWVSARRAMAVMAERDAVTRGLIVKTSNGTAVPNPLLGIANKAAGDLVRYAAELGLTPIARLRVKSESDTNADPAAQYLA